MVLVALLIGAITVALALTIDVAALLARRQELTTMAELGAAAGGLVVSGTIAELASAREPNPPPEDRKHPERFLTPDDRRRVQNDPQIKNEVNRLARDYTMRNRPASLSPFVDQDITVTYPVRENSCTDPSQRFVDVEVTARYAYPFILGRLIAGSPTLPLRGSGISSIRICP